MITKSTVKELWITSPGAVFILHQMPPGISYFSADGNPQLKVQLLLSAVDQRLPVTVVCDDEGTETREAIEIRLCFHGNGGPKRTENVSLPPLMDNDAA